MVAILNADRHAKIPASKIIGKTTELGKKWAPGILTKNPLSHYTFWFIND